MTDVVERLRGPFPPVVTPFGDDDRPDPESLARLVERLIDAGIGGLTLLGSSSEATYMTQAERTQVFSAAAKAANGRPVLVAGVICFGTGQAVDEGKRYRDAGADALMVALPQYYETPLAQIIEHYRTIRREVDLPILYYHYPKPTHLTLTPDEVAKLFAEVDLCGIKNSSLDTANTLAMIRTIDRPIRMFTGQSFDYLPCLQGGAVGSICPVQNLMPKTALAVKQALDAGDEAKAQEAQTKLYSAVPIVMPESNESGGLVGVPDAGIKEALVAKGIFETARVRGPQPPASAKKREEIRGLVDQLVEI